MYYKDFLCLIVGVGRIQFFEFAMQYICIVYCILYILGSTYFYSQTHSLHLCYFVCAVETTNHTKRVKNLCTNKLNVFFWHNAKKMHLAVFLWLNVCVRFSSCYSSSEDFVSEKLWTKFAHFFLH